MRYRYIHILAALFLIIGMAIQFVVSYRQSRHHIQERIDLKMQIAQEVAMPPSRHITIQRKANGLAHVHINVKKKCKKRCKGL